MEVDVDDDSLQLCDIVRAPWWPPILSGQVLGVDGGLLIFGADLTVSC